MEDKHRSEFVLIGTMLVVKQEYVTKGFLLFGIYLIIRFGTVYVATLRERLSSREKVFMTLNMPQGVDVVVVILLMMSTYSQIGGIALVINLGLLFVLLSIVMSSLANIFLPIRRSGIIRNKMFTS